jgi:mono/diheme cytochrome c family protein
MRIRLAVSGLLLATLSMAATAAQAPDFSSYTGAELYKRFCSACHGATAEGDGPVAASFKIMVPDLTRIAKRQGGKFPDERIHRIIDGRQVPAPHGSREMPIWGWEFATVAKDGTPDLATGDLLVARLVDYLRSVQKP